uniref:Amino acid transporter transmembrane domain-containing protein n=1 Tax=Zea mays TaxID=4577 RepID=A0A804LVA5_MAIZE
MAHARTRDDQPATVALAPKGRRATSDAPAGGEGGWSGQDEKPAADDDWLPVNARRNTKWWYAAFHNVRARLRMARRLPSSLPADHRVLDSQGRGRHGAGPVVGHHGVHTVADGGDARVRAGEAVRPVPRAGAARVQREAGPLDRGVAAAGGGGGPQHRVHDHWRPVPAEVPRRGVPRPVFASVHFVLSQLPDFHSISSVSLAADVMSVGYSAIAWTASAAQGKAAEADVDYSLRATTTPGKVFGFLGTLGEVAFTYAGHNVVLEIQATIPSTPGKPSKKPMWKGVIVAYVVIAACYLPVALVGYWAFGNDVDENILITLNRPRWLIVAANMMVVVHVVGSYQVYAMPVFDMIETVLVKTYWFTPGFRLCLIAWTVYIALTMFMAITFPFFSELLSFFGGFAYAPTSYFLPCIMWLIIYKPRRFSLSWLTNWICIVIGVLLMVLSPIGGLRQMILKIKTYKFYQDYSGLSHN